MSDVEKLYKQIAEKMQCHRPWNSLHHLEQMEFVDAINVILRIMYRGVR